jgi:hypothetical protein
MWRKVGSVYCNGCGRETFHDILASHRLKGHGPGWGEDYREEIDDAFDPSTITRLGGYEEISKREHLDIYEIVKCKGCGSMAFVYSEQSVDALNPSVISRYPPAIARRKPDWIEIPTDVFWIPSTIPTSATAREIPDDIRAIMQEVYVALQNGSLRLVAMGVRAALERLMINTVGDHGRFRDNVDEFQKAGYLSVYQKGSLDSTLEGGHAAVHRLWKPTIKDVDTLLDITQSLIEEVYLHVPRAAVLEKNIPPRPRRLLRREETDKKRKGRTRVITGNASR